MVREIKIFFFSVVAIEGVNEVAKALTYSDVDKLLHALRSPSLKLSQFICDFAGPLYLEEMRADYLMAGVSQSKISGET